MISLGVMNNKDLKVKVMSHKDVKTKVKTRVKIKYRIKHNIRTKGKIKGSRTRARIKAKVKTKVSKVKDKIKGIITRTTINHNRIKVMTKDNKTRAVIPHNRTKGKIVRMINPVPINKAEEVRAVINSLGVSVSKEAKKVKVEIEHMIKAMFALIA